MQERKLQEEVATERKQSAYFAATQLLLPFRGSCITGYCLYSKMEKYCQLRKEQAEMA